MKTERSAAALQALGLSELEAQTYVFLLGESPATGYRVAQALGRRFSNVYKALEALEAKGAVQSVDDGGTRHCRAVPVGEFLARLERAFEGHRARAAELAHVQAGDPADDRTYPLRDLPQLYDRCRAMLKRAAIVVTMTACPVPLAELRDDLAPLAKRRGKVAVGVKVFAPIELPGAQVIVDPRGLAAIENGPGQWLNLNVDGREYAMALLTPDGTRLLHAVWCGGAFLAWSHFTGLSSDLVLADLRGALARGASAAALRDGLARLAPLETPGTLGKRHLMQQYRAAIRPRKAT